MKRLMPVIAVAAATALLTPAVARADPGEAVTREHATFPYLGVTADVEKVDTGKELELRAFVDGKSVDLEELLAADDSARRERFGALDPGLAEQLGKLDDNDRVRVAVWLREPERALGERPADGATVDEIDSILAKRTAQRSAEVAEFTDPWLDRLRRYDDQLTASSTSPLVWAELPVGLVRKLAADERIDTIYGDFEKGGPETNLSRAVVGADSAPAAGLNGAGVQVAIVEGDGLPEVSNPFYTVEQKEHAFLSCYAVSQHATGVAGIIGARPGTAIVRSPNFPWSNVAVSSNLTGFANGARLFAGSWCATGENRTRVDGAVNWGARVINNSYFTDTTGMVTVNDRHADGVVHNNWRLFVKSTGNRGQIDGRVTSPGNGYNVLAVGNVDLHGTSSRTDDTMDPDSSSIDPTSAMGDREKPEVSAPGANIAMVSAGFPWSGQSNSGTSFAAPMVTGEAARLIQRDPSLGSWPEQLRAIIMASALNNVEGATRLSEVDGAGMIAIDSAVRIVDQKRHGGLRVACSSFAPMQTVTSTQLSANQRLRAAISWTTDPSAPDHATRPSADLDLRVRGPNGAVVATSASFDNTSEIVDFRSTVSGRYDIEVVNFRCARDTFVGWAHTLAP